MLIKVLTFSILSIWATRGHSEVEDVPPALHAQILLLSVLKGADSDRLTIFVKINSLHLHDATMAGVIRKMRSNSGQSPENFAAALGVTVDELHGFETEGTGVSRELMEKMWDISPLSIREFSELRSKVISAHLTSAEVELISQKGVDPAAAILVLRFAQKAMKKGETLSVEAVMRKVRSNHAAIEEFMRDTLSDDRAIISADAITDELIQVLADSSAVADALQEHTGFIFLRDKLRELQKAAISPQGTTIDP